MDLTGKMPYIFTANRSLLATSLLHQEGLSRFLCNKGFLKLTWSWDKARRCGDKRFETGARSLKTGSGSSAVTEEVTLGQACPQQEPLSVRRKSPGSECGLRAGSRLEPRLSRWRAWPAGVELRWGSGRRISDHRLQGPGPLQRP